MTPYIDYRLVPNSTDEKAVLAALQAVSAKFHLDGVAVAATFDIETDGDPKAAILAVSKKFNVSVMRLEWGHREDRPALRPYLNAGYSTQEAIERAVERQVNRLDRRFMKSDMSQEAYDAHMTGIRQWAEAQYAALA